MGDDSATTQVDEQLQAKVAELRKSEALMATFVGAAADAELEYLEFFASTTTLQQTREFVARTLGKHFEVVGYAEDGHPLVELREGSPQFDSQIQARGLNCWRAQVAFWAWWAGTELLCIGAGAAAAVVTGPGGVVVGVVCNGVFAGLSQLPDFNSACR